MIVEVGSNDCGSRKQRLRGGAYVCVIGTHRSLSELIRVYREGLVRWAAERGGVGGSVWWGRR